MKRGITIAVLAIVTVVLAFLVAVYVFGFLQRGTADFRGETKQKEDTQANSSYRMAAYDHFYDMCAGIQSIEGKIGNMEGELADVDEKQRESILNASIMAAKNKRVELVSSYNADARKEATEGQFRSSDLPYEINENEEVTACTVQ